MRRKHQEGQGDPGGDSFLDIVSNIVGILIILVMVVGAKIKDAPAKKEEPQTATAKVEKKSPESTNETIRTANALAENVMQLRSQLTDVHTVSIANQREAERLLTIIEIAKRDLEKKKNTLSQKKQRDFELNRQLITDKTKLNQLQRDLIHTVSQEPEEVKVKSYPTPISKAVYTKEEHYRLQGGKIVRLPFTELQERLIEEKGQLIWKLRDMPEVAGLIGPIDGFRLWYHFKRTQTGANLTQAILRSTAAQMGETLDQALQNGSAMHQALSKVDPRYTTITVWTYPDSFDEFRKLKKELYSRGFAIAARPVPKDGPIGFSPTGTRSVAQ